MLLCHAPVCQDLCSSKRIIDGEQIALKDELIANFNLGCDDRDNTMSDAYVSSRLQTDQNHFGNQNLIIWY